MIKIPKEYEDESMVVYLIRNNINGKLYVGMTTGNLKKRMKAHVWSTRSKRKKTRIQSAILKYGSENFSVSILEKCEEGEELARAELKWISIFNSGEKVNGYNILTQEYTFDQSKIGIPNSKEHRKNSSNRMHRLKDEYIKIHQKEWVVIDPSGKIQEIVNLQKFCRENDLDPPNMVKITTFRKNSFNKGWQCFKKEEFSEDKIRKFTNGYKITKKDGTFEEFKGSLTKYAATRELDMSALHKLRKGNIKKYKDIIKVEDIYIS
jgi:group I intron endonuclease